MSGLRSKNSTSSYNKKMLALTTSWWTCEKNWIRQTWKSTRSSKTSNKYSNYSNSNRNKHRSGVIFNRNQSKFSSNQSLSDHSLTLSCSSPKCSTRLYKPRTWTHTCQSQKWNLNSKFSSSLCSPFRCSRSSPFRCSNSSLFRCSRPSGISIPSHWSKSRRNFPPRRSTRIS